MKRRHPITPTDQAPSPLWKRSAPREVEVTDARGRRRVLVEVDAMTLADVAEWYRVAGVEPAR